MRLRSLAEAVAAVLLLSGVCAGPVRATTGGDWYSGGHIKGQYLYGSYPEDSLLRELTGASSQDYNLDVRIKAAYARGHWEAAADYQFIVLYGDTVEFNRQIRDLETVPGNAPTDENRWFDLTQVLSDHGRQIVAQRLDRLYVGYRSERWVARFGRQVVSWGNGMVFTAMDFFNPFDPAAVDKEYKPGDDMLYGQYLRDNGDDLQLVGVVRRNVDTGDVEADVSSLALKYHAMVGNFEYDALAAYHYSDPIVGIGGSHPLGGAIWRGDLTLTRSDEDTVPLLVTSLTYTWVLGGKNVSGIAEYFYNGFGIADGDYSPLSLAAHPELTDRIARGELFTLGRNYLVGSLAIEITPLFTFTPNVFTNITDPSALAQFVGQFDLAQDLQLLAALNIPIGANGTEYGGIDSGIDGLYLSTRANLFLQLAWYF